MRANTIPGTKHSTLTCTGLQSAQCAKRDINHLCVRLTHVRHVLVGAARTSTPPATFCAHTYGKFPASAAASGRAQVAKVARAPTHTHPQRPGTAKNRTSNFRVESLASSGGAVLLLRLFFSCGRMCTYVGCMILKLLRLRLD